MIQKNFGFCPKNKEIACAVLLRSRPLAGMVRALISLGGPFEIALPGIIGLISATFGIWAGVGSLSAAPLLILLFLPGTREK